MSERLIGLIAADLPGHRLSRKADGAAVFEPEAEGPVLEVTVRVEKRFLGRTEIARFRSVVPARAWGRARLSLHHTGRLKRQGIGVRVDQGSEAARLAEALRSDPQFAESAADLDFTRFDLESDGENCEATIELMGASLVSIAFPPIRSYVRLHDDQREALVGCLAALQRLGDD
ncbi:MAG: DUF3156 family protein [Acidimicrobiia bacterium]